MSRSLALLIALQILITSTPAADWPQWQGPNRDAISLETGLLQQWHSDGPPLAWRVEDLGGGDSAPAVANGQLFGMSNRDGKQIVWALSESDGREVWVTPLSDAVEQHASQSRAGPGGTPTIENGRVYVIGMGGCIACLRESDGEILWQRSFTEDFGGIRPYWSYRESPLVDGDNVLCTPGSPTATLVALDKMTGDTVWVSRLPGKPMVGTNDPHLFNSDHWGMTEFSLEVANGRYQVNLHFAETDGGIRDEGERVFSFDVHGRTFEDFDILTKVGHREAYTESVPVNVTDGQLRITFTKQVENPSISAIEIIPQSRDETAEAIRINAGASTAFTDSLGHVWQPDTGFRDGTAHRGRSGAGYSSVIAIDAEGQRQYVQMTSQTLLGVAAEDGEFLWRYDRPSNEYGINCSTPIFKDGLVFASSAYGNGGGAVRLAKRADGKFEANEVYFTSNMQNHHGGMIVHDGCIYGANGGNGGGFMACLDFQTGKVLWRDRDAEKGSLAFADGRLYLRTEGGEVILIEPNNEEFVERGRFDQPDRTDLPAWAHPIIANGKLYIRDQNLLLCYDVRDT